MTATSPCRKGLSIAELIVGMVILGIIGMALTRIMVAQARYFDHQKTANLARNVSRGPLNRVVSDIRMVEALGGVLSASPTAILARVPYAMGVVCANVSGNTHISILPVDSALFAGPGFSGYAWRKGDGVYRYVETGPPLLNILGDINVCNVALINTLLAQKGRIVRVSPALVDTASVGTPIFMFRRIKYEFKASLAVPGTTGLFRTVMATGAEEELSAPYASDAKFRFFIGSSTTAQDAAPANLSTLRGIELNMTGLSEKTPRQGIAREKAPFITAVFFKNRLN